MNVPIYLYINILYINFSLISKPKVVYLRTFLSSLTFPKFWKQNFMYYGHKHVETSNHTNLLIF